MSSQCLNPIGRQLPVMTELAADISRKLPEAVYGTPPTYAPDVLRYFQHSSSTDATIDELERYVCEHSDSNPDETRVRIQLHHSTLPKLAETDLFDYDPRSNTARFRGRATDNE